MCLTDDGAMQAVASRLSFHDPATGNALDKYSLQICLEDATYAVTAQLSHEIIQGAIGELLMSAECGRIVKSSLKRISQHPCSSPIRSSAAQTLWCYQHCWTPQAG